MNSSASMIPMTKMLLRKSWEKCELKSDLVDVGATTSSFVWVESAVFATPVVLSVVARIVGGVSTRVYFISDRCLLASCFCFLVRAGMGITIAYRAEEVKWS